MFRTIMHLIILILLLACAGLWLHNLCQSGRQPTRTGIRLFGPSQSRADPGGRHGIPGHCQHVR